MNTIITKPIITKPIIKINTDELDIMMIEDILGDVEDHNEIYKGKTMFLNDPIKIDTLRKYLDTLEANGANYVAIDYHEDHQEYEFDGLHVSIATQEEIDEHIKEQQEKEIVEIKNRLSYLSSETKNLEARLKQLTGDNDPS